MPSGANHTTPNGGRVSSADHGCPCHGVSSACTPPFELEPHLWHQRCPDGDAELALVAGGIRTLLGAGTPAAEIAILVRTNAQLPPLEEVLTLAGIPFQLRGQGAVSVLKKRPA